MCAAVLYDAYVDAEDDDDACKYLFVIRQVCEIANVAAASVCVRMFRI